MRSLIFLFCIIPGLTVVGQVETPVVGLWPPGEYQHSDSVGSYWKSRENNSLTWFIAADYQDYRLWENNRLRLTGNLGGKRFTDYFQKFGEWKEYYDNGQVRSIGHYEYNTAIGTWKYYYPDGKLKKWFTISEITTDSTTSYCKTGQFQEFYENGYLRINGYYKLSFDTMVVASVTIDTTDYTTLTNIFARGHRSKPDLTWTYYKVNGEIEKEEQY